MNFCYNNLSVPFIGDFDMPNSFPVVLIIVKNFSLQLHCLRKGEGGGEGLIQLASQPTKQNKCYFLDIHYWKL